MPLNSFIQHFVTKCAPQKTMANAFAPTNIAVIKYWGKRDPVLNLPITDSLSLTLPRHGTTTEIKLIDELTDQIYLNDEIVDTNSSFYRKKR